VFTPAVDTPEPVPAGRWAMALLAVVAVLGARRFRRR
jgi:MYXO-CTERM domain-containing protein